MAEEPRSAVKELIPFNSPPVAGDEINFIKDAIRRRQIAGGGFYTKACETWLERKLDAPRALLVQSCTAALEMACILADLRAGDEVIMPSFTFVSMANAVALRGAVPVFVDIREDTLNIDERLIESAITPRTRAVMVVHYAGVCAEMDTIREIAARHSLLVIEDAAHALMSTYRGRPAGTLGDLACLSFHETKNVVSGEGGALIVNHAPFVQRAEIVRDKGTDRAKFLQGLVDKYSWIDMGSSFVPSDITAAFLCAQLDAADRFTADRVETWRFYHKAFEAREADGSFRRPRIPSHCIHNGHIYYLLLPNRKLRDRLIKNLADDQVQAIFHYVPLHSSRAGQLYGRNSGSLAVTEDLAGRLLRLPLWYGIGRCRERVVECVLSRVGAFIN